MYRGYSSEGEHEFAPAVEVHPMHRLGSMKLERNGSISLRGVDLRWRFLVRTEVSIDVYRVDFLMWKLDRGRDEGALVVVIDGWQHELLLAERYDEKRDRRLLALGFPTMRFTNDRAARDVKACLAAALRELNRQNQPA
jgi:very-short-patch-repair endonuclease